MREKVCTFCGLMGSAFAALLGGWDTAVVALVIFMAVDYISGSAAALIFHRSSKTRSGAYSSSSGFKGLMKKLMILLFVLVGNQLDRVLGCDYIRSAVCIGFLSNELISIVENAGLMGLPLPKVVTDAIELLQKKS